MQVEGSLGAVLCVLGVLHTSSLSSSPDAVESGFLGLEDGPVYDARDGPELVGEESRADLIRNLVRQRPSLLVCSSVATYDIPRDRAGSEFSLMRNGAGERVKFSGGVVRRAGAEW